MALLLVDLPHEVLFLVFSQVDVDTFLDLRLVSRPVKHFIHVNEGALCRAVALTHFGRVGRLLEASNSTLLSPNTTTPTCDVRWLKRLRYQWIAAVLLEGVTMAHDDASQRMSGADPLADGFRAQIAAGLELAENLIRIKAKVAQVPQEQLPPLPDGPSPEPSVPSSMAANAHTRLERTCRLYLPEDESLHRRKWAEYARHHEYCRTLPVTTIQGFLLANYLLRLGFDGPTQRWIIRQEGPKVLWKHWGALDGRGSPLPVIAEETSWHTYGWEVVAVRYEHLLTSVPFRLFDHVRSILATFDPPRWQELGKPIFDAIFKIDAFYSNPRLPYPCIEHQDVLTYETWRDTTFTICQQPERFDEMRLDFDPCLKTAAVEEVIE